jgi:hypothetical protein
MTIESLPARLSRLFASAMTVAAVTLAIDAPGALAQNVSRGQTLYAQLGCGASNCHGANPAENLRNVLNGAGSSATIEYAALVRSEMNPLLTSFESDPSVTVDLAAYLATITPAPPPPPPAPPTAAVVEYFHAAFGHYFVTNLAAEITALDSGTFAGWARTGRTFNAYASGNGVVMPVCRFFTVAFAPKSSHFYTPFASECAAVKGSADWTYEGEAFFVDLPDANGQCVGTANPVYRLYNNGLGGAPNHRYATDPALRAEMLAKGWVSEGLGPLGVIFCVPG